MNRTYLTEKIIASVLLTVIVSLVVHMLIFYKPEYKGYTITDWMINYQSGFIRRGLCGDILWHICRHFHCSPGRLILLIDAFFICSFIFIAIKICRNYGISTIIVTFPIACCAGSIVEYRRDFMVLWLCYGVYMAFFKSLSRNNLYMLLVSIILMTVTIIIYEPIFFILTPILFLQYFHHLRNLYKTKRAAYTTLAIFIIPIIVFFMSCINCGNKTKSDIIWQSWIPLIEPFANGEKLVKPDSLTFMEHDITDVFVSHLIINFGDSPSSIVFNLTGLIILFWGTYYLCTFVPITNKKNMFNIYSTAIGPVLLLQCFMQIPLFTILSTDYGRTIPQCIYTTLMILHLSHNNKTKLYIPLTFKNTAININKCFIKARTLHPEVYFIILFFIPIRMWGAPHLYDNIIVNMLKKVTNFIQYNG